MLSFGKKKIRKFSTSKGIIIPLTLINGLKADKFEIFLTEDKNILLVPIASKD